MTKGLGKTVAGISIPDSNMAKQAAELLLEHGSEFLYNHSLRTYLFGAMQADKRKLKIDRELYFVCSAFHDLGLMLPYRSEHRRFEVDGAEAAMSFLKGHGVAERSLELAWDAIALHTSPGIAEYKQPEVAMLNYATALDVVGKNYQNLTDVERREILALFPRLKLKLLMVPLFFEGFGYKPQTTWGTMNADICACMIPHFEKVDYCDLIRDSPWEE